MLQRTSMKQVVSILLISVISALSCSLAVWGSGFVLLFSALVGGALLHCISEDCAMWFLFLTGGLYFGIWISVVECTLLGRTPWNSLAWLLISVPGCLIGAVLMPIIMPAFSDPLVSALVFFCLALLPTSTYLAVAQFLLIRRKVRAPETLYLPIIAALTALGIAGIAGYITNQFPTELMANPADEVPLRLLLILQSATIAWGALDGLRLGILRVRINSMKVADGVIGLPSVSKAPDLAG